MNIQVNKKFLSLLLAGAMSFSLCACKKEKEINLDTFSLNEVIADVEEDSLIDDVLEDDTITLENPFNGDKKTMNMVDASEYIEDVLGVSFKIHEMGINKMKEDDELYYMIENEACTWSIDDTRDFISDVYYDNSWKKISLKRLEMMAVVYDKELRTNGINIVTKLLEDSIDNFDGDTSEYIEYLDNIKNIRDNIDEFDYMSYYDMCILLDNGFDLSKEIIYRSGNKNVKVLTKINE